MEPVTAIAAVLAVDVFVLLMLIAWMHVRGVQEQVEALARGAAADQAWKYHAQKEQEYWQAILKEERAAQNETLRHLLNRIQDPNFAITEVPASELEKTGVDYDEGAEEAAEPPVSAAPIPDLDELSDEELELEDDELPARHINFAELSVDPAQPQQPHQPLKVGSEEDGVSGS
jgi:hypothetical protein